MKVIESVCIVGAGAIGSLFAGHLGTVSLAKVLVRRPEHRRRPLGQVGGEGRVQRPRNATGARVHGFPLAAVALGRPRVEQQGPGRSRGQLLPRDDPARAELRAETGGLDREQLPRQRSGLDSQTARLKPYSEAVRVSYQLDMKLEKSVLHVTIHVDNNSRAVVPYLVVSFPGSFWLNQTQYVFGLSSPNFKYTNLEPGSTTKTVSLTFSEIKRE